MYYVFLASCRSELHHLPDQGVILSGHVLISYTHTSWTVNKIASALRCVRSADQSMAIHNRPFESIFNHLNLLFFTKKLARWNILTLSML